MPRSDAMDRAIKKYEQEKVDRILFRVPKGMKETIQNHAEKKGESPFIVICDELNPDHFFRISRSCIVSMKAINSIINVKEESDLDSFLSGGDVSFGNIIRGLDDFELICFLVVR